MARAKAPPFAALPARFLGDERLKGLHVKVLGAIALHDRMSLVTGAGQGCWASSQTLADKIGANLTAVSRAIGDLRKWGYVQVAAATRDKRKRTYRVIYEGGLEPSTADCSPVRKDNRPESFASTQTSSVRQDKVRLPDGSGRSKVVCPGDRCDPQETAKNASQYISLSDERDFAEATEGNSAEAGRDSAEAAHLAVRSPVRAGDAQSIGGQLARFERDLRGGVKDLDLRAWGDRLGAISEELADSDPQKSQWAYRLAEETDALRGAVPCEHCRTPFALTRTTKRYCSEGCRKSAEVSRRYSRSKEKAE